MEQETSTEILSDRVGHEEVLVRMRRFRLFSWGLMILSLLVASSTVVYAGLQTEIDRSVVITDRENTLGSNLSHVSSLGGDWHYRLEVEELVLEKRNDGELFGLTHLKEAYIQAFKGKDGEEISFYAPEGLWDQKTETFFLYGGCRIWQGKQMDVSTASITIDFNRKMVIVDEELTGRYGESWFFEAESAQWDIANDNLIFDGYIEFGKRAQEI